MHMEMANIWSALWRLFRWLGVAFTVFVALRLCLRAVTTAWVWNGDQIGFALYGALGIIVLGFWATIWWREGTAGMQAHWRNRLRKRPAAPRFYMASLLSWIVIAVALVLFFTLARG